MKKSIIRINFLILILVSLDCYASPSNLIRLASGPISGIYFPIANNICKIINNNPSNNFKCLTMPTEGSVYNLEQIAKSSIPFGISDAEILNEAFMQQDNFKNNNYKNLRLVFFLHEETYSLVTRKEELISNIKDLIGKKINIGIKGSGTRKSFENLFKIYNLNYQDFEKVTQYSVYDQAAELCNKNIDAAMYMIGHPNNLISEAAKLCDIKFIPITGKEVNNFISQNLYYFKTSIPSNLYGLNISDTPIETIGSRASVVTNEKLNQDIVYNFVKSSFESIDLLKSHNSLNQLEINQMVNTDSNIPFHDGALKYFREIGLE